MPNLKPRSVVEKQLIDSITRARIVIDRAKADKERRREMEPFEPLPLGGPISRPPLEFPKK